MEYAWVVFKNGTKHIAKTCRKCDKFCGYAPQHAELTPLRVADCVYDDEMEDCELIQRDFKKRAQAEFVFRG